MDPLASAQEQVERLPSQLTRDRFLRDVVRELSGSLESVIGLDEAQGFVSLVGQHIGEQLNDDYRAGLAVDRLTIPQIAAVLVDLKARIQGRFRVVHLDENEIVLLNETCPFGGHVADRQSLCMMTSNVFGTIAAENAGYAQVALEQTIARGHDHCRVVVRFKRSSDGDSGREYFAAGESPVVAR